MTDTPLWGLAITRTALVPPGDLTPHPLNWRLHPAFQRQALGGPLDFGTLSEGAIPLTGLDAALTDAIRQLWRWSNWQQQKNRVVRTGANLGDAPIKIVPDLARGKVRLEVLDPMIVQAAVFDAVGNVKKVVIGYDVTEGSTRYSYQEIITGDSFQTLRDGQPYAYPQNVIGGQAVAEWANPYGFVPLVIIPHRDVGKRFGGSAYANVLPKVNEVNDLASKIHDLIRVSLNPVYYAPGVNGPRQLTFDEADQGSDQTDPENRGVSVNVLYGPEGSSMMPLVPQIDIVGALGGVDRILAELERDLPELALPNIRERGDLTAPGVRAGYSDAIARYQEARGQYDDGLVRAQQMAISIGAYHGFEGFEPFSLDSYRLGHLEHYVEERPVIADDLTLPERISILERTGAPASLLWKLCGLSEEEIAQTWATRTPLERPTVSS